MAQPDCTIAIVGGGPCGAATALFLAHAAPELRERIVVIDKARFPRDKICAGAIGARADRALGSIGVEVRVPEVPLAGISVATRTGSLRCRLDGPPVGRVIRRREHDAALLDRVRERGIAVREGVALAALRRTARRVALETSAGELTAEAVVGADGVGSAVRRALGMPRGELYAQAVEVDTPLGADDPPRDLIHFDIRDRSFPGYAWDFPTLVNGEPMVCRGIYELRHGAPEASGARRLDVAERLRRALQARGFATDGLRFKRFAERGLSLHRPLASERVLLAGEAAGIDPVLGEGIAQAILYGATVGRYLADKARLGDFRFGDWRAALMASRVGLDLKIRRALLGAVYGKRRPLVERWVTRSMSLATAGMAYFGGRRVPRAALGWALLDLLRVAAA